MITIDGITIEDKERTQCEVWSRVMGYHRPVSCWNNGKVSEFKERKYFDVEMAVKRAIEDE
jgi:hypothetical protein